MNKSKQKWDSYIDALKLFIESNGHSNVPSSYIVRYNNKSLKLGPWVGYMRSRGRANNLSTLQKSELNSLPGWSWRARKPGPAGDRERDAQILKLRKEGVSLQKIADRWELSRQRVHQIVGRSGK